MSVQRLSRLQWFGLFAGPAGFALAHVLGYGLTIAQCNSGGARWGIDNDPWAIAILTTAAFLMLLAGVASTMIVARTQGTSYDDDPPLSRIRFFAITALFTNTILIGIMTLDLVGNVFNTPCRGA